MTVEQFSQLGVSGVIVVILLAILRVLWADNKELRRQAREDQAAILPKLTEATQAMGDFVRVAALLERGRR